MPDLIGVGALQLEAAVDEVALDRLMAEEAERESRAAEEPLPDPERIPIEAPRAPRRTTSDLSTSTRLRDSLVGKPTGDCASHAYARFSEGRPCARSWYCMRLGV